MNHEVLRQLNEHAQSSPEREVCGFLYPDIYVPLRNLSLDPLRFQADPRDVAAALARHGEPAAVFHTHPSGPAVPSAADIRNHYYVYSTMMLGVAIRSEERSKDWSVRLCEREASRLPARSPLESEPRR